MVARPASPPTTKPRATGKARAKDASQRAPKRERALVTAAAGGLGRLVCRRLHRSVDVVGVDRQPFPDRPKDVDHHEVDLRRKAATQLLKKKRPDVIVHIGGVQEPPERRSGQKLIDATVQLLKLAEQVKARKFVLVSSAILYGPSATSAAFLSEEAPLLAAGDVPELSEDISLDMMVQSFFWKRPEIETVILRPVHVVGPHIETITARYLRGRVIPTLIGFDPMVQLLHEDDLVEAISRALVPGVRGVFNVVGATQAPLSRMIAERGARTLPLPDFLLRMALSRATALRLSRVGPGILQHLRYACLVDGTRAHNELGFVPKHSLKETLHDLDR